MPNSSSFSVTDATPLCLSRFELDLPPLAAAEPEELPAQNIYKYIGALFATHLPGLEAIPHNRSLLVSETDTKQSVLVRSYYAGLTDDDIMKRRQTLQTYRQLKQDRNTDPSGMLSEQGFYTPSPQAIARAKAMQEALLEAPDYCGIKAVRTYAVLPLAKVSLALQPATNSRYSLIASKSYPLEHERQVYGVPTRTGGSTPMPMYPWMGNTQSVYAFTYGQRIVDETGAQAALTDLWRLLAADSPSTTS